VNQAKALLKRLPEAGPETIAHAALVLFGLIAFLVTITAIAESYSNLMAFGMAHGMTAWHGAIAPVAVDAFIVMGEVLLLAGILLRWTGRLLYAYAGALVVLGFGMSVGGNVFRATPLPLWADRAVQAIWPVTATAALTGCLIIIKRLLAAPGSPPPAPASSPRKPRPATGRAVRDPEPAAARDDLLQEMAGEISALPRDEWPAVRALARDKRLESFGWSESTRRRFADGVLDLARPAVHNGTGHGGD